jgi:hypothetical protein
MDGERGIVEELTENRFSDVSLHPIQADAGSPSAAVLVDLMKLGKVRRNQFIGNDIGMMLTFSPVPGTPADLGTFEDRAGNVFRCNSALVGAGGDFVLAGATADPANNWGGIVRMQGNMWDHIPVFILREGILSNGTDIAVFRGQSITVDVGGATLATSECPSGRIPGE